MLLGKLAQKDWIFMFLKEHFQGLKIYQVRWEMSLFEYLSTDTNMITALHHYYAMQ